MALAPALAPVGWVTSDRLEADNDFCNACHLPSGTPLHLAIREEFDRVIPHDLSGVHGRGLLDRRESEAFRCIDCHAGTGLAGRARVKLVSARDGLRYPVGDFTKPDHMTVPLPPALCRSCHARMRAAPAPGWYLEPFHGLAAHEDDSAQSCTDCHAVHEPGGDAFAYFMRENVDARCVHCHEGSR